MLSVATVAKIVGAAANDSGAWCARVTTSVWASPALLAIGRGPASREGLVLGLVHFTNRIFCFPFCYLPAD